MIGFEYIYHRSVYGMLRGIYFYLVFIGISFDSNGQTNVSVKFDVIQDGKVVNVNTDNDTLIKL
jgi:hypothetical protein